MAINIQDNNKNNLENNEMENTDTHKNNNKRKFIDLNDKEQLTIKKNKVLLIKTVNTKSYDEAINSYDSNKWKDAIKKEINNLYEQKVMRIVNNIPKDTTLIDTSWVFTTKDNGVKRAILVARRFKQRKDVNYTSIYSPTIEAEV